MKKTALLAALLASVCLPLTASAAQYQVTVSGTLDSSFTGTFDPTFGYDLSSWQGKTYSMRFIFDNNPANAVASGTYSWDEVLGNMDYWWKFNPSNARLDIGGVTQFSGTDFYGNQIGVFNDQYVPQTMPDLPPGLVADKSFDGLFMESGHSVGCQGGPCDWNNPNRVEEGLWIYAEHIWDELNAIPNNNLPDLLNSPPTFTNTVHKGFVVEAGRWSPSGTDDIAYSLTGSIESVTISAVPEPETYVMLLAGLGLVGWKLRGRR